MFFLEWMYRNLKMESFSHRESMTMILKKIKMERYNPVLTPLTVNEKLSKADGDAKEDVT